MPKSTLTAKPNQVMLPASETVHWDTDVLGLGCRTRGTSQTWIVQWRDGSRTRKQTLGKVADISWAAARQLAAAVLAETVDTAHNWSAPAPSVSEFSARFLNDLAPSWKPKTLVANTHTIRKQILPHLGEGDVGTLTRDDIVAWMRSLRCAPGTVNRAVAVLSGMMRHAEIVGHRTSDSNPCKGLRRRKSSLTATYLNERQWARLGQSLRDLETDKPGAVGCIRFLALTGCRRGEAQGLKWTMIDGPRVALPDAKTGPRAIWLGRPAKRLLASFPKSNTYVFGHGTDALRELLLTKVWHEARKTARLGNLRLHDLRHSFASVAINTGLDLREVGGLLGHIDLGTTEGYAHLEKRTVTAASHRVGVHLSKSFKARPERQPQPISHVDLFRTSPLSLIAFCEAHGLDPDRFRRALVAQRKKESEEGARS